MAAAPRGPLVGRHHQLRVLDARIAEACSGLGGVVFIAGEPGIGKTSLATAAVKNARARGCRAVWGRCREEGGAPPYWPWVQVVRGLLATDEALTSAVGVASEDLQVLTEPEATQAGSRFRLYEAVGTILRKASERGGLVVVLDDVHKADEPSLALLRYLTAGLADARALVLSCFRDTDVGPDHPLRRVLGSAEPTSSSVLHLQGLADDETAELVAAICGPEVGQRVAPEVAARSGGNPLFVVEIARLVQSAGVGAANSVPATVREVIHARLSALPPETIRALRAAAVVGRAFGAGPLAGVLGCSELAAVAALQPAAAVQLLTADPEARGIYQFAHAVVQEALYEQLPVTERTRLHRNVADALAARGGLGDDLVSQVAFHRYHAALDDNGSEALEATVLAARRASRRLAHADADRWLTLSLQLAERCEPDERLSLLLEAAEAAVRAGHRRTARTRFEEAADLARSRSDGKALADAALGLGTTVVTAGLVDWPLVRLLEEAVSLEGLNLTQRTALLSRLAVELYWQRGNTSAELSGEALSVAERSGDDRAIGVALHARQFTLRGPGGLAERIEIGERLVALALRLDDLDLEFEAHAWLAADVLRAGEIGRFLGELQALERVAERSREPLHRWYAQVYAAELAGLRGQQRDATLIAEQAAELGGRLEVSVAPAYRIAQLVVSARDLGTLGEIEGDLRAAVQDLSYFPTLSALLALVLAETGRMTEARAEIERLAPGDFAGLPPDALWTTSIAVLGEAAVIAGSPHTGSLAALLDPYAGEILVHGIPACWGAVDRVRGLLAAAAGRWDEADLHFASALVSHRRLGAPAWEARTVLDEARSRRLRGDRSTAASLARTAAVQAAALRLNGLQASAEQLCAAVPAAQPHVALSPRERQVVALLASGASNKEIAAELVVSVHTIERHLANIYAKVGAKSRSDASAYAVRNGLA